METYLEIPFLEYMNSISGKGLSDQALSAIRDALCTVKDVPLLIYGVGFTASAVAELMGNRNVVFVLEDTIRTLRCMNSPVFVAISPAHYDNVAVRIREENKSCTIFFPFSQPKIEVVIESIPRSGTHYTYFALCNACHFDKASTFDDLFGEEYIRYRGNLRLSYPKDTNGYLVFSHIGDEYTDHLLSLNAKRIYLYSYIFDCVYSWCHNKRYQLTGDTTGRFDGYVVSSKSIEWDYVASNFYRIKRQLYASPNFHSIRFEDYFLDFQSTVRNLSIYLGRNEVMKFEKPDFPFLQRRMYITDAYEQFFDTVSLRCITSYFEDVLETLYPEKKEALRSLSRI